MKYFLLLTATLVFSVIFFGCSSSEFIQVKVRKSAFIPDKYELNRDSLITGGIRICTMGQRFYHKPTLRGGGGNSFVGFVIPQYLDTTSYGIFEMSIKNNLLKVIGKGNLTGYDDYRPMQVELVASPKKILSITIIN